MSDIMLLGVLRMPLPDDPAEVEPLMWRQLKDRIHEAATRIERDAGRIAGLEADLREECARIASMRIEWGAEVAALTERINALRPTETARRLRNDAAAWAAYSRACADAMSGLVLFDDGPTFKYEPTPLDWGDSSDAATGSGDK